MLWARLLARNKIQNIQSLAGTNKQYQWAVRDLRVGRFYFFKIDKDDI